MSRAAFLRACALDVAVRKPGNVSAASPGHGMDATQFLASAEAAAPALFEPSARVGTRIEGAVTATLAIAGCNTNLGIVLLCAPLARALEQPGAAREAATLRAAARAVLEALDIDDARAAYRAIAAARPGGLGRAAAQDVAAPPSIGLREAMALAAARDRVAAEYASGYAELFEIGLPALQGAARVDAAAVQRLFLALLAHAPDTHIARKHGPAAAQAVTDEAARWLARAERGAVLDEDPNFADWDEALKAAGLNPGTTADLTVAALFLDGSLRPGTLAVSL